MCAGSSITRAARERPTSIDIVSSRKPAWRRTTTASARKSQLPSGHTAVMGTAANMNYVAIIAEVDEDVSVTAAVTAGVEGNATAAGEPATWRETDAGVQKVPAVRGHDQHHAVHQPSADACGAGARGRDDDGGQDGRAAAAGRAEQAAHRSRDRDRHRPVLYCRAGVGRAGTHIGEPAHEAGRDHRAAPREKRPSRRCAGRTASKRATRGACFTRSAGTAFARPRCSTTSLRSCSEADLELLRKNSKARVLRAARWRSGARAGRGGRSRAVRHAPGVGRRRCDGAAGGNARSESGCTGSPMVGVPLALRPYATGDVKALVLRAVALGWSEKWRTGD